MRERFHTPSGRRATARARLLLSDERAAQLVEFAVSLPLLLVFVVGIFDFSGAFTLKQKLTHAARDAARAAVADPASDLSNGTTPASVSDAFQTADNYLLAEKINDCGLSGKTATPAGKLTWTYTASTGCPAGGITLTINRGYYFPETGASPPNDCQSQPPGATAVIATCVNLQYAYQWRFNRVIGLLKGSAAGPSSITTSAVALNEN